MTIVDAARHKLESKLVDAAYIEDHELNALDRYGPRCASLCRHFSWGCPNSPRLYHCRLRESHQGLHRACGWTWATPSRTYAVMPDTKKLIRVDALKHQRARVQQFFRLLRAQGIKAGMSVSLSYLEETCQGKPWVGIVQHSGLRKKWDEHYNRLLQPIYLNYNYPIKVTSEELMRLGGWVMAIGMECKLTLKWDGHPHHSIAILPEESDEADLGDAED